MDFHCMRLVNFVQLFQDQTKFNKNKSNNNEEKGIQTLCKSRVESLADNTIHMQNQVLNKSEDEKIVQRMEIQKYENQNFPKIGTKSVTIVCNQDTNKRPQKTPTRYKKTNVKNSFYSQSDNSLDSRRRCRTFSLSSVKRSLTLKHFLNKRWSGKTDLTKNNRNKRRNKKIETLFTTSKSLNNSSSSSSKLFQPKRKMIRKDRSIVDSNDSLFHKVAKKIPWVKRAPVCFVVNNCERSISNRDSNERCRFRVIDFPSKNIKRCSSKQTSFEEQTDNYYDQMDFQRNKRRPGLPIQKIPHEQDNKHFYSAEIRSNEKERSPKQSLRPCLRKTPHATNRDIHNLSTVNVEICKNKPSLRYDISTESGDDICTVRNNDSLANSFPWSGRENYCFESSMIHNDRQKTTRLSPEKYEQRARTDTGNEYISPKHLAETADMLQNMHVAKNKDFVSAKLRNAQYEQSVIDDRNNHTNSFKYVDDATCTCDSIMQAKSRNTSNQQITKHEGTGLFADKIIAGTSKVLQQHDSFTIKTHPKNEKCKSNENVQPGFYNVLKCPTQVKSGLEFSKKSPDSGRKTLKQILFCIVTLAWSPCLLMVNFKRCLTKPFHIRHQHKSLSKELSRRKNKSIQKCSILSNSSNKIKNDTSTKSSKRNLQSNIKQSNFFVTDREKVPSDRQMTYTLHHISDKGWVLKPNLPKGTRRRRSNFGSIFQTYHFKRISKPVLRKNMSSSSHECFPSQYKKASGTSKNNPQWNLSSKQSVTQNKNTIMPIKNIDCPCREVQGKVSFVSSSQSVGISERGSRPRMRHTKQVDRGDQNEKKYEGTRSRSEPKRVPSISSVTQTRTKQSNKKTEIVNPSKSRLDCGDQTMLQNRPSIGQSGKMHTTQKKSLVACECVKADSCECYPKQPRRDKKESSTSNYILNDVPSKCNPNDGDSNLKKSRGAIVGDQTSYKNSLHSKRTSSISEISKKNNVYQENTYLKKAKGDIKFDRLEHKKSHLSLCSSDICDDLKRHAKRSKKSIIILSESRNKAMFKKIRALLKKSGASIHFTNNKTHSKLKRTTSSRSLKIDITKSSIKLPDHDQSRTNVKNNRNESRGSIFNLRTGCSTNEKHNQSLQCIIMPKASKRDKATEYKLRKSAKKVGSLPFCKKIICRKRKSHNPSNEISPNNNRKSRRMSFRTKYKSQTCYNVTVPQNIQNSKYSQYSVSCSNLLPIGVTVSTQPSKSTVSKHICTTIQKMKCSCARTCHKRRRKTIHSKGTQKNSTSATGLPIPKNKSLVIMECRTHRSQQCSNSSLTCADCLQKRRKHYCPPFPPPKPFPPCSKSYSSCRHYPPCPKSSSCLKPRPSCQKLYPPCHKSYSPCKRSHSPCQRYTPVCRKSFRDCTTTCPETCPRWRWYRDRRQYPYLKPCQSFRRAPCKYCKKKKKCWCSCKRNLRNFGLLLISPFTCAYNILYSADWYGWDDNEISPCTNIRLNNLRSKPCYRWFAGCPDLYLEFWECQRKCQDLGRCCCMFLAGCIWIPCMACCYYLCKALCRICSL